MDQRMPWIIGLSIVVGAIAIWRCRKGRERRTRFERREELGLDTIYFWFFAHRGLPRDLVLRQWCEVADSLGVQAGKLRPSDRFDEELAFVSGWGFEDEVGRVMHFEMRRLESGRDSVAKGFAGIQTLGDYIDFFCDLELKNHGYNQERGQKIG